MQCFSMSRIVLKYVAEILLHKSVRHLKWLLHKNFLLGLWLEHLANSSKSLFLKTSHPTSSSQMGYSFVKGQASFDCLETSVANLSHGLLMGQLCWNDFTNPTCLGQKISLIKFLGSGPKMIEVGQFVMC
jgi:hypothetical protein